MNEKKKTTKIDIGIGSKIKGTHVYTQKHETKNIERSKALANDGYDWTGVLTAIQ